MLSNKTSVIIVTYNHRKYMEDCLSSVLANNPLVIVVDNCSTDGTAEFIEENFPQVNLKSSRNLGYGERAAYVGLGKRSDQLECQEVWINRLKTFTFNIEVFEMQGNVVPILDELRYKMDRTKNG